MALVTTSFVADILTGFCCCTAMIRQNNYYSYNIKVAVVCIYCTRNGQFSPSLPASCSWIFSISIGVVITTWHMPAPHPANISLNTVSLFLLTDRILGKRKRAGLPLFLLLLNVITHRTRPLQTDVWKSHLLPTWLPSQGWPRSNLQLHLRRKKMKY